MSLSFSQSEYTVSETDSTFLVQLNKNKPLANPLEVGVAALTLEEADLLGYLSLNNSFKQAGIARLILCLFGYLYMCTSGRWRKPFDRQPNFIILWLFAEVDEDFRGTSYFSSRATFTADDEGGAPTNQLNISIPLIIDDVIAEDRESFVVVIELRPLCESGALVDVQRWSSLIHITDDDGKA